MMNKKTFKDFAHEDLNVFFNLDEFGEEHELDGEVLTLIVVDSKDDDNFTDLVIKKLGLTPPAQPAQ